MPPELSVFNNGWILIDAILTLLLGILILCNQLTVDIAIPMIFGMWVLVSGLLRFEASTRINRQKKMKNFKAAFISGLGTIAVGLFGFINPLVTYVSVIVLLGIFLIVQGRIPSSSASTCRTRSRRTQWYLRRPILL